MPLDQVCPPPLGNDIRVWLNYSIIFILNFLECVITMYSFWTFWNVLIIIHVVVQRTFWNAGVNLHGWQPNHPCPPPPIHVHVHVVLQTFVCTAYIKSWKKPWLVLGPISLFRYGKLLRVNVWEDLNVLTLKVSPLWCSQRIIVKSSVPHMTWL